MDPIVRPIDAFITYDGKRSANIPVQRYATRQMIAGEVSCFFLCLYVRHR